MEVVCLLINFCCNFSFLDQDLFAKNDSLLRIEPIFSHSFRVIAQFNIVVIFDIAPYEFLLGNWYTLSSFDLQFKIADRFIGFNIHLELLVRQCLKFEGDIFGRGRCVRGRLDLLYRLSLGRHFGHLFPKPLLFILLLLFFDFQFGVSFLDWGSESIIRSGPATTTPTPSARISTIIVALIVGICVIIVSTIISAILVIILIIVVLIVILLVIIVIKAFLGNVVVDIWVSQTMLIKISFYISVSMAKLYVTMSEPTFITSWALFPNLPFVARRSLILLWIIDTDALLVNLGIVRVLVLDRCHILRHFLELVIVNSIIKCSFSLLFLLNRILFISLIVFFLRIIVIVVVVVVIIVIIIFILLLWCILNHLFNLFLNDLLFLSSI